MTKLDVVEAEISFRPESDGDAWAPRHLNSTLASSYRLHIVIARRDQGRRAGPCDQTLGR